MNEEDETENGIGDSRPTIDMLELLETQKARSTKPYDGILGTLHSWVPEPIHRDFERYRDYVIDRWGYKPAEAVEILDQFLNSSFLLRHSKRHPNGEIIDFTFFSTLFGFLHKVRWALNSPPEDALYLLSGKYAVSGYRSAKNLPKKGRPRTTLQILVARTISDLKRPSGDDPSAEDVANNLHKSDNHQEPILDVVDKELGKIFYFNNKGKPESVGLPRFKNIVSEELNKNK